MQPISKAQSDFLTSLGRTENQPKSKEEASKLISKLLLKEKAIKLKQKVKLFNFEVPDVEKTADEALYVYCKVLIKCVDLDITDPPVIGMIYNQTMAKL